jgi:hypothetical protein
VVRVSKHIHDESDRNKQVKFRANEDLIDELDASIDVSRAEWLRQQIADHLDAEADSRDEFVPTDDDDLAEAYRYLLNRASPYDGSLIVNFGDIKEDMAESLRVGKDTLKRRYFRKLRERGYIGQPQSGRFEVKPIDHAPRPPAADSKAVATDGGDPQ